jgi:hypothetical protein
MHQYRGAAHLVGSAWLRIGQRVVLDGRLLVGSSVRLEGAGGGVVSVEFAGAAGRSTLPPGDVLTVAVSAAA